MKLTIEIADRVGDKVLVMSSAQFAMYQADPDAFLVWLERTGRLPDVPAPKKPLEAMNKPEPIKVRQIIRSKK